MVFGRVIRGYEDVIPKIVDISTDEKDRPKVPIVISNCGELELRKKPVDPQSLQRKRISFTRSFLRPFRVVIWCRSSIGVFSPTRAPSTRWSRLTTISFPFPNILFFVSDSFPTVEEAAVSRDVVRETDDSPKRSRSGHKQKKRRKHRSSDGDSQSRSLSPSRSHSPSDRDHDPASGSESDRNNRGESSRKRHRAAGVKSSSRKHKHQRANRPPSRSRSPMDLENQQNRGPGVEEHKETEEEYDARLEREENERIAAEKRRRLEALKARHERDLEKPPQNGVRFKGAQAVSLLLVETDHLIILRSACTAHRSR